MKNKDVMEHEDDVYYKFDVCQDMLEWQSKILDRQSKMFEEQSKMLDKQSQMLDKQFQIIEQQTKLIADKDRKMAKKLFANGDSVEDIAEFLNIDVEVVKGYVE